MIDKVEALVLRVAPYSRTSHVVTWLTAGYGRLVTLVKGACRPKSAFLGQYDLFYTCELLFYARDRNGLHIARECAPLDTRRALRNDWRAAACASYLCDLLARISLSGGHQADVYPLAVSALDVLCRGARPELLFWFELRLLTLLGFAPRLTQCARCGAPARDRSLLFSHADGGVLCPACSRAHPRGGPSRPLSPALLALLRRWNAHGGSAHAARNIRCSRSQLSDARDLLGFFLDYHLDLCPESRKLALQMMAS